MLWDILNIGIPFAHVESLIIVTLLFFMISENSDMSKCMFTCKHSFIKLLCNCSGLGYVLPHCLTLVGHK